MTRIWRSLVIVVLIMLIGSVVFVSLPALCRASSTCRISMSSFTSELLANMVGALIGAVLAIPTGLWIDRKARIRTQLDLNKLATISIRDELAENLNEIKDFLAKRDRDEGREVLFLHLSVDAWETAKSLGAFTLLQDYDCRRVLGRVYAQIEYTRTIVDTLWNTLFNVSGNVDITLLDRKIEILYSHLSSECKKTASMIEDVLSHMSGQA